MAGKDAVIYREIKNIWVYFIPLGWAVASFSRVSDDQQTRETLAQMNQILKTQGMLDFDGHRSELDIMTVAAQYASHFPSLSQMIGPIAAKWADKSAKGIEGFIGRKFFKSVNRKDHLKLIPVIREEDKDLISESSNSQKKSVNDLYYQQMTETVSQPNTIGEVALYGKRKEFMNKEKIRKKALDLARLFPSVCSLARFDWKRLKYVIYLSQILTFDPSDSDETMKTVFQNQFETLDSLSRN